MILSTLFRTLLPRHRPATRRMTYFLVRTGDYVGVHGQLTAAGHQQAQWAAETIRQKATLKPVVVLMPEGYAGDNGHYVETAQIIAKHLGTECATGLYSLVLALMTPDIQGTGPSAHQYIFSEIFDASGHQADRDDLYVAVVMNGSVINEMLDTYPGPLVSTSVMGPPHGSVQQLVMTYDQKSDEPTCCDFV